MVVEQEEIKWTTLPEGAYKTRPINLMMFYMTTDKEYNAKQRAYCKAYNEASLDWEFNRNKVECVLYTFLNLPDVTTETKLKIQEFMAKPFTSKELCTFLDTLGAASQFWEPPIDEPKMIDLEWCEDHYREE